MGPKINLKPTQFYFYFALIWFLFLFLMMAIQYFHFFQNPYETHIQSINEFSSFEHWFGTDELGRDLFARMILGAKTTLFIAFMSASMSVAIAFSWATLASWNGGIIDLFLMRTVDILASIPNIFLSTMIALILIESQKTQTLLSLTIVIAITHWFKMARIIRVQMIQLKSEAFIEAAEALGASPLRIFIYHFFPHLKKILILLVIFEMPTNMLSEGLLSFMGVGIHAPDSSWGLLLQEGWRSYILAPHLILFPSLFLFISIWSLSSILSFENQ